MTWIREVAGWLLLLVALYILRLSLLLVLDLENPRIIEATVMTVAGLGVLRAAIILIRLSTAARLYQQ